MSRPTWIRTRSGRAFDPFNPDPAQIDPLDVAHALSNLCRFAGHAASFYSVAEHSVAASRLVSPAAAREALLHDAAEAYVVDLPLPIKRQLSTYVHLEQLVERAVEAAFGVSFSAHRAEVKAADDALCAREMLALMPAVDSEAEPASTDVLCLPPEAARAAFVARFNELFPERAVELARSSWDDVWMRIAWEVSARSYDPRLRVGAIVARGDNTQILALGYNGAVRGAPHAPASASPGESGFIHAEANALVKLDYHAPCAKTMYVTHSPCPSCARLIANAGVQRVVWCAQYRDASGLRILGENGVVVDRCVPTLRRV